MRTACSTQQRNSCKKLCVAGDGFLRQSSPAAPAAEERLLPPHLCALVKQLASRMEQQLPAAIAARVGICD